MVLVPSINALACGDSVGAGTTTMTGNLQCATGNGLNFNTAHAVLDMNGFNISCHGAGGQIGIDINANDVNITNTPGLGMAGGWVYNCTASAVRFEAETGNNGRVDNVSVSTNLTDGFTVFSVSNVTLNHINATAIATSNTANAVNIRGGNNGVDILNNVTLQNSFIQGQSNSGASLINVYWLSHNVSIINNTIRDNATGDATLGAIDTTRLVDTVNISGNNITTTGPRIGIDFLDCYMCSASNNRINTTGSSVRGIVVQRLANWNNTDNATIFNNTVNVTASAGIAIYVGTPANFNTITNNSLWTASDGIDIQLISGAGKNAIYYNNLTGSGNYIDNVNANNTFNTTGGKGNIYANISLYTNLTDANLDGWADGGAGYPANATNTPGLFKSGSLGNDSGPGIISDTRNISINSIGIGPVSPSTFNNLSAWLNASGSFAFMNVSYNWSKNGVFQPALGGVFQGFANNSNTTFSTILNGNLTQTDNWSVNVTAANGSIKNTSTSSNVTIASSVWIVSGPTFADNSTPINGFNVQVIVNTSSGDGADISSWTISTTHGTCNAGSDFPSGGPNATINFYCNDSVNESTCIWVNASDVYGGWNITSTVCHVFPNFGYGLFSPTGGPSKMIWKTVGIGDTLPRGGPSHWNWSAWTQGDGILVMNGSPTAWNWVPE